MSADPPFTFAIPLRPASTSVDWDRVQALLTLTLRSVLGQTDPDLRVMVVGHDRPSLPEDSRLEFVQADWSPEPPGSHEALDVRRKRRLAADRVIASGGGLLMNLDADDWVDRTLAARARVAITADHIGGLIRNGGAVDFHSMVAAPLPHPKVYPRDFHTICGSSIVLRYQPESPDPIRRDPFVLAVKHNEALAIATALGLEFADLPVLGAYVINTGESWSALHSWYAAAHGGFISRVQRGGTPVSTSMLARFSLTPEALIEAGAGTLASGATARVSPET